VLHEKRDLSLIAFNCVITRTYEQHLQSIGSHLNELTGGLDYTE